MKLLNLGCGGDRDPDPIWTNLDDLHSQLEPGTGARTQLNSESNYVNFKVLSAPLPFPDDHFDGVLASHFFEHFDAQECLKIMADCKRVMKSRGVLAISVPDAAYFLTRRDLDRKENWPQLFEINDPGNTIPTWMQAALFFEQHKQLIDEVTLQCFLYQSGFTLAALRVATGPQKYAGTGFSMGDDHQDRTIQKLAGRFNRRAFSLEVLALKP